MYVAQPTECGKQITVVILLKLQINIKILEKYLWGETD